jgi:hypothetical protein
MTRRSIAPDLLRELVAGLGRLVPERSTEGGCRASTSGSSATVVRGDTPTHRCDPLGGRVRDVSRGQLSGALAAPRWRGHCLGRARNRTGLPGAQVRNILGCAGPLRLGLTEARPGHQARGLRCGVSHGRHQAEMVASSFTWRRVLLTVRMERKRDPGPLWGLVSPVGRAWRPAPDEGSCRRSHRAVHLGPFRH